MAWGEKERAEKFAASTGARLASPIAELIAQQLSYVLQEGGQGPIQAVDLNCGTGYITVRLQKSLPVGSRVVALSEDRMSLNILHRDHPDARSSNIFPRKAALSPLPFAPEVFDLSLYYNLIAAPPDPVSVLKTMIRALRPGGAGVLGCVLKGSLLDLSSVLVGVPGTREAGMHMQNILSEQPLLPSPEDLKKAADELGAEECRTFATALDIPLQIPLSEDPLIRRYLGPLWLGRGHKSVQPEIVNQVGENATRARLEFGGVTFRSKGLDTDKVSLPVS